MDIFKVAARALRARAANDTTRAQINNIPEKSHVIPLLVSGFGIMHMNQNSMFSLFEAFLCVL